MTRPARIWIGVVVAAALILGFAATIGPPPPTPNPPGSFSFAVLGDAPYQAWEEIQHRLVIREIDSHNLSWAIHIGDIFWRPCTDEMYARTLELFTSLRHPVIYTPGDNEWYDCWEPASGSYDPLERFARIRQVFFSSPARSLGMRSLTLVSQAGSARFAEFAENVRWTHEGVVFLTVHLIGTRNGTEPFPTRTEADGAAAIRRTEAAAAWLREAFAEARAANASAVVVAFHGNPKFEDPAGEPYRQAFEPFISALEEETERFGRPVLAAHGDFHEFVVDHPLVRRTTGRRLDNFTRLQVPGSPRVGWVRVVVTPGAASPFAFEDLVLPRWKYW